MDTRPPRPLLGALLIGLLVATGCRGPAPTALRIAPAEVTAGASLRVTLRPGPVRPLPGRYRALYLREQDWRRAEVTLSLNGDVLATRSVDAAIDPATGARTAALTFGGLVSGAGYALTLALYRPSPEGPEELLGTVARTGLTMGSGTNELDVALGDDGKVVAPAAAGRSITGEVVASWPRSGPGGAFARPYAAALEADGSIVVIEKYGKIRRVSPEGVITTVAGDGVEGFADGPAATARFNRPQGVGVAPDGAIIVADASNHRLRRISPDGTTVSTIAGDGTAGRVDGAAASSRLSLPHDVVVAADGTIYVSDKGNGCIRRITADGTTVSTYAGDGVQGFADGAAASARFFNPHGLVLAGDGALIIADADNNRIRRISPDGATVSTVAGDGTHSFADGPAASAQFRYPHDVAVAASGAIIVMDTYNYRLRQISADGTTVATIAGDGTQNFVDGPVASARFYLPTGLTLAADGAAIPVDSWGERLRRLSLDGTTVSTLAGDGSFGMLDGPTTASALNMPWGLAVAADGALIVPDVNNHRIRRISPDGSDITTVAGSGTLGYADGPAGTAMFNYPYAVLPAPDGALLVADGGNGCIRRISPDGATVSTYAGDGTPGFVDGAAASSRFDWPSGLAWAADGTLVVADSSNSRIRSISADGTTVATLAGDGTADFADGPAGAARFNWPGAVAFAADGALIIADVGNHRIRRLSADGTAVSTLAGDGTRGFSDGAAATARFSWPSGVAVKADGTVLVADYGTNRVRAITADGASVSTVAGSGGSGYVDGAAATSEISQPAGLAIGPAGEVYVSSSSWIRRFGAP